MTNWDLFVDESGQFNQADDDVTVAALLMQRGHSGRAALAALLKQVLPHIPFPQHSAHLNHPLSGLVWNRLARKSRTAWSEASEGRKRVYAEAEKLLHQQQQHAALLSAACASAEKNVGRAKIKEQLEPLWKVLRRQHTHLASRLQSYVSEDREMLRQSLKTLANENVVYVFYAGEAWRGDSLNQPDRYLDLLQTLIVRVADVLGKIDAEHQVYCHILGRRINDAHFSVPVPMQQRHLLMLFNQLFGSQLTRLHPRGSVQMYPLPVASWNDTMDARLVVADFVANQARRVLKTKGSLEEIELSLAAGAPLPLRLNASGLPHLCAGASVRELLLQAQRQAQGEKTLRSNITARAHRVKQSPRLWAIEQAVAWLGQSGGQP